MDIQAILNTIRANASSDYQDRVPEATSDNIASVGNPIWSHQATSNEFLRSLVERIAMVIVQGKIIQNPLKVLKKGGIPYGMHIEETFTNPATAEAFDSTTTGGTLLTRKIPDVKAVFHRRNRQDQYTVTISREQLVTAFTSFGEMQKLIETIVNSLYSGDNLDEFILMKDMLTSYVKSGNMRTNHVNLATPNEELWAKDFMRKVRASSLNMTFPSSNYNSYKVKLDEDDKPIENKAITWTPIEDQVLILNSTVSSVVDIDVLAHAFNMSRADYLSKTLLIDSFGDISDLFEGAEPHTSGFTSGEILGIICDKAFVQVYDNLTSMTEFFNPKGLYHNFFWNHWQTYSCSPFANSVAIIGGTPTEETLTE